MKTSLVLTVIADDQPGIIEAVSSTLKKHSGNWTKSSMSSLAGQFAGILLASIPDDRIEACCVDLQALESRGLKIIVRTCNDEVTAKEVDEFSMQLVGNDRPGIVHEITTVLARNDVSVKEFETSVESASMSSGSIFKASAHLLVPEGSDIHTLEDELENLANDLMVDIKFKK